MYTTVRFYSYSTLRKFLQCPRKAAQRQFPRLEWLLLSGAKFLLLDRQRQLGFEVHDGSFHHNQAVLVQ